MSNGVEWEVADNFAKNMQDQLAVEREAHARCREELATMTESRDGWQREAEQMYALIVSGVDPGYPRASLANGAVYAYATIVAALTDAQAEALRLREELAHQLKETP